MNSDAGIAAHLSIRPKVNGPQNFTGFFWVLWAVSINHLSSHTSYQPCVKVLSTWVKLRYSSEIKLIYTNCCTSYIHNLLQYLLSQVHSEYIWIKHSHAPLSLLLPKCQPVFIKSSYFCCSVSLLDSLCYFWRPTGKLAGTKQEFAINAVLAFGLCGFNT